jgi:hypothetical protein
MSSPPGLSEPSVGRTTEGSLFFPRLFEVLRTVYISFVGGTFEYCKLGAALGLPGGLQAGVS